MPKKQYRIAPEVKADILRRVKEEGISVVQAAKDHGVSERTIYAWLTGGTSQNPSVAEFSRIVRQNKELLELIGELTLKLSAAKKTGKKEEQIRSGKGNGRKPFKPLLPIPS